MLELDPKGNQVAGADLIKDSDEATFMADVVEGSQKVPVIVDFWAPWCGPCRQLTPAIEAAVKEARGAVRLVKVNVDENQGIAGQLRVQSIPAVFGFWQGQPIDGFQGAVAGSEIKAFIDRLIKAAGGEAGGGLSDAVESAEQMLTEGAAVDAAQVFAAVLEEDFANAAAHGGLIRSHLALGQVAQAEQFLTAVPEEITNSPEIEAARAQLELARQALDAGPVAELRAAAEADPEDNQALFDLALALHAEGDVEASIEKLLNLFRRDQEWNEGAAKVQLFTIFDALKPNDPVVLNGRRRLSSIIFA